MDLNKLLICFLFLSNIVNASCLDLIKLQISKDAPLLIGEDAKTFLSEKKDLLHYILEDTTKESIISSKRSISSRKLQKFIDSKVIKSKYQKIALFLRDQLSDPIQLQQWAFDLYTDILAQTYISGSVVEIDYLVTKNKLPQSIGVEVIEKRVAPAGFSGIEILEYTYDSDEFSQVLRDKKIMLDREFEIDRHGSMIHMLQVDLIVYILKKHNMNPTIASEFYEWMGSRREYILEEQEFFNSLHHGWGALFDSTDSDITSPEEFYPILRAYFNWYIE